MIAGVRLLQLVDRWRLIAQESIDCGRRELGGVEKAECFACLEVLFVCVTECVGDCALVPDWDAMVVLAAAAEELGADVGLSGSG